MNLKSYLPHASYINTNALSSVFNYTSATYKFYWFLGIMEGIDVGKRKISKKFIFTKMISNAWYPINYFKLSFGSQDKIAEIIKELHTYTALNISDEKLQIEQILVNQKDKRVITNLNHLNKNVPHKFLSPWFKSKSKREIYTLSQNDYKNCIYQLYDDYVLINENWFQYLQLHSKIIKDFIFWNLALFIQARNPNIPDVINKLIKPGKRNSLTKQRNKFWSIYLKEKSDARCIFTDKKLDFNNYHLDHFVPYSFVSHDQIWNLIPIDPEFNGLKSNRLPPLTRYFDGFYNMQKEALKTVDSRLLKSFKEEYRTIFPNLKHPKELEYEKFKETIQPLITVAYNNGFEYLKNE